LLFRQGQEIGRALGPLTADQIVDWTHAHIAQAEKTFSPPASKPPAAMRSEPSDVQAEATMLRPNSR
jgi:hypothetical protein